VSDDAGVIIEGLLGLAADMAADGGLSAAGFEGLDDVRAARAFLDRVRGDSVVRLSDRVEVINTGTNNPLIVINRDEFMKWLRQMADQAGFTNRPIVAIQLNLHYQPQDTDGSFLYHAPPDKIVVMVSNIKEWR